MRKTKWKPNLKKQEKIQFSTGQATVLNLTWDPTLEKYWVKLKWDTGRTSTHILQSPNHFQFENGYFFKTT